MRKKSVLIALIVLALGLIETWFSSLYTLIVVGKPMVTGSYGFPFSWHGYYSSGAFWGGPSYWFSLQNLLLDAVFWTAINTLGYFAIVISIDVLHKARASKNLLVINI